MDRNHGLTRTDTLTLELRQYFPKGMNLANLSQDDLDEVAKSLITRPRKTLAFATPEDTLRDLMQ